MVSTFINSENMLAVLQKQMNAEMMAAAEPVIKLAIVEAEKEMRKRLSAMFVAMIESSFDMYRDGRDLHIKVLNVPN